MNRKIISAYAPKRKVILMFAETGRTKSQFMQDCDINRIVTRAEKTGVVDHIQNTPPTYGDVGTSIDFQESMNTIIIANAMFADLSSRVRRRFDNNPAEYLEFIEDPQNEDEMRTLGILNPLKEVPEPLPIPSGDPSPDVDLPSGE